MPDFLSIPGNIRQQYMPFTIKGPGFRQVFSFKDVYAKKYPDPCIQIHPFSNCLADLIANDSGIRYTHGPDGKTNVDLSAFLDEIPSLQIREYVPDAKLTQTFKWFSYFKKGFDAGLQNIDGKSFDFASMKSAIDEVMKKIGATMKDLTSGSAPLLAKVVGGLAHFYQDKGYNIGEDNGFAVLFLPFIMYYRLTTTHTNNVYEIPFSMQNEIMKSDGTYGWTSSQSDFGIIDRFGKAVTENPLAKLALGNTIRVNMMPSFQPTGDAKGESFTINIDLINDTDEAAVANFLMCHTLFGNNRWLQYGFVQAGASLYDVKLPGANRYFMCAGQFSCKGKGAFRSPSDYVCKQLVDHIYPENTFAKKMGSIDVGDNKTLIEAMVDSRAQSIVEKIGYEGAGAIPNLNNPEGRPFGILQSVIGLQTKNIITNGAKRIRDSISTSIPRYDGGKMPSIPSRQQIENAMGPTSNVVNEAEMANQYKKTVEAVTKNQDIVNDYTNTEYELGRAEEERDKYPKFSPKWEEAEEKCQKLRKELIGKTSAYNKANEALNGENGLLKKAEQQKAALITRYKTTATAEIDAYKKSATVKRDDIKKLIKIPDVYSLTLTFNSLLPDNFNNYLYGFRAGNLDPIENYARGTVDEVGVFEKLVQQLEAAVTGGG